ncbi:MAG: efflux RND transporter periplasmic adaptor subunit [Chloroflexota bacterium]|nr:efflux RND transporter periplasmic adaptor subunit [Chloroflexota bacterium]
MNKSQIPNPKSQIGSSAIGHWSLVIASLILLVGCGGTQVDGPIVASGFIEGEEAIVASEVSGRIAEMLVERGDAVQASDVLVRLDDALLQNQRTEAEAGLSAVQANLDHVMTGARSEEIAAARAALTQAKADRDGASQAVLNAQDVISNPLALDAEIAGARTQVDLAEQNVEMAEANLAEMELLHGHYSQEGGDARRTWDLQLQASRAALTQAEAELEGAQNYLNALWTTRSDPLMLETQLHGTEMQLRLAEAQVSAAQAALDELEAGPTAEEIAVAEAQVRQAEAVVGLIDAQIAQLALTAPMDGMVTSRSSQTGEIASAGAPLLTIANLDEVTLVIYIPETRVGQVQVGQEVQVQVDSFPERVFVGQIASIAGEAEFTPRNVQTQEERVNLVFAIKVHIPNGDGLLKPGMPADATLID